MQTLLVLSVLLLPLSAFAKTTASVDRNRIGIDETFQLTISTNKSSFFGGDPELAPLNQNFKVLGKSQSSRHSITNGHSESTTEWKINLMSKRLGNVVIPPIDVDGEKTLPIVMKVSKTSPSSSTQSSKIYAEAEFDQQDAYVQSQLIFTLRLISAVNLVNLNVETPTIAQAFVEKLSDSTYEKTINGEHFGVYEIKYAIFPQASGELSIPPVLFSGAVPERRSRSVFDPFNGRGKAVRLRSPQASITIKEQATDFSGSHWLPSKRIRLEESWSKAPDQLKVGESVTRTIKITAVGLMAEQLSPLKVLSLPGVKTYPDQAQTQSQASSSDMISTRIESVAILPTQAGTITLPAIKLAWWDTTTDRPQVASLPQRTIEVTGTAGSQVPSTQQINPLGGDSNIEHPTTDHTSDKTTTNQISTTNKSLTLILSLLTLIFASAWIITLFMYWRLRKSLRNTNAHSDNNFATHSSDNEKQAFRQLTKYCRQNDPQSARAALLAWAKCHWHEHKIRTLEEIKPLIDKPDLFQLIQQLDQILYGDRGNQGEQNWNGEKLLRLIAELRKQPTGNGTNSPDPSSLQPLYPI